MEQLLFHEADRVHLLRGILPVEITHSGLLVNTRDLQTQFLAVRSLQGVILQSLPHQQPRVHHAGLTDHHLNITLFVQAVLGVHLPCQQLCVLRQSRQGTEAQGDGLAVGAVHQGVQICLGQAVIVDGLLFPHSQFPIDFLHQLLYLADGLAAIVLLGDQRYLIHGGPCALGCHICFQFILQHPVERRRPIQGKADHRGDQ